MMNYYEPLFLHIAKSTYLSPNCLIMQKLTTLSLILLACLLGTFLACTNDELPEPEPAVCNNEVITYDMHIKEIIDLTCAYDGCHIAGFSSGDFTSYAELQPFIDAGIIETRAVVEQNMPPSNVPAGMPAELTDEQLELLQCWIDGGYLEN